MAPLEGGDMAERPREPERLVADAAGRLEVGEAEVFRLAHCRWFGREPEPLRFPRSAGQP